MAIGRSALRAERRADKNGTVVTRHVRDATAPGVRSIPSALPSIEPVVVLSDSLYSDHLEYASEIINEMRANKQETMYTMTSTNARGEVVWNLARQRAHDSIINDQLDKYAHLPRERKSLMSGGMGGAGKSFVLNKFAGVNTTEYATINPDDIKEIMAERGLIPEIEGLSPMEVSPLVHEEASMIAKELANCLLRQGTNVIFDVTMASAGSTRKKVMQLKEAGYEVDAVFVDVTPETSMQRAADRHRRGWEKHKRGEGHGGRILPHDLIEAQRDESGQHNSKNRHAFENLKNDGLFNSTMVYDNNVEGRHPIRVG